MLKIWLADFYKTKEKEKKSELLLVWELRKNRALVSWFIVQCCLKELINKIVEMEFKFDFDRLLNEFAWHEWLI